MGMMGMFKWLRKDIVQRDRNGWNVSHKQCSLNNESYRNALQAFIDRRRISEDASTGTEQPCSPDKRRADFLAKNNNNRSNNKCDNEWKSQDSKVLIPGVPHIRASEIFEIGWVAGTEDRYLELIFAEWQNTRVSLKRHTHPECRDAVKADLEVLSEIRHPNVLLLMATTQTDDHGLISILESVDCTLYNYIHEQGERLSIQGIAKCGGRLSDALRHSHMRGYVHGAISSHCIYLASSGIVKLGGWELAVRVNDSNIDLIQAKPGREFEERLRTEIFRWQAPEIFYGYQPCKETDVYGLALLIWEMCTMHVPWSGHSRADVERQYVHWKRGVIMDLYDFPPLLNNLLEAGLQLDVSKRTLDMNRMRRFLQRLEMQYEDEDPVYIDQYVNNNNETGKTYITPMTKSPKGGSKFKSTRLIKSASAKQLAETPKTAASPSRTYLHNNKNIMKQNLNTKLINDNGNIDLVNITQCNKEKSTDDMDKNINATYHTQNVQKRTYSASSKPEDSDYSYKDDNSLLKIQPWNATYRKVSVPKDPESGSTITSIYSTTSAAESGEESFKDARTILREIKEVLADKREHFFYGSDSSSHTPLDTSSKDKILAEARNTDCEPHKPASHKTSLEPKCNKSPGQYDPSYMKSSFQQYYRIPAPYKGIKDALAEPQVLNSDSQDFFETSLWKKEKMICMSKMRRHPDADQTISSYTDCADSSQSQNINNTLDSISSKKYDLTSESAGSANTYVIYGKSKANPEESQEISRHVYQDTRDSSEIEHSRGNNSLQTLKNALDRATEIIRSTTPNTDTDSCPSPPFKTYQTFEVTVDDTQDRKSVFEDIYDLKRNDDEDIQIIERSTTDNETFLLSSNSLNSRVRDINVTKESDTDNDISVTYDNFNQSSYNATYTRNFICESIAEVSSESNISFNDTKPESKSETFGCKNRTTRDKDFSKVSEDASRTNDEKSEGQLDVPSKENKSVITNLTLTLLNDKHNKNCKSCNQSALPRRRSLPAALCQLRGLNNSALGKLPIRKGDMPDSTVEDLYIDDEFGDTLNVNMVLLDEELSFDGDFLPDLSEL